LISVQEHTKEQLISHRDAECTEEFLDRIYMINRIDVLSFNPQNPVNPVKKMKA
jgi:hypothetical protein